MFSKFSFSLTSHGLDDSVEKHDLVEKDFIHHFFISIFECFPYGKLQRSQKIISKYSIHCLIFTYCRPPIVK